MSVEVQVIVSSDSVTNGMLLEDRRKVFDNSKYAQNDVDPTTKLLYGVVESTAQGPKSTGIVDVVLGIDQNGFKKLFIDLLSSLP